MLSIIKKVDRALLILELTIIAIPITLFLVVGASVSIFFVYQEPSLVHFSILAVTALSIIATFSVWRLAIQHLKFFQVLNRQSVFYWFFVFVGAGIAVSPVVWNLIGPPVPYSKYWYLYDLLSTFIIGILLIIPASHVFISAYSQKVMKQKMQSGW